MIHTEKTYRDTWDVRQERMTHESYEAYLASPEWAEIKAKASKRKNSRYSECYLCARVDGLELHHKSYNTLGTNDLRNIVAVCREHHQAIHDLAKAENISVAKATRRLKAEFGPTPRQIAALEHGQAKRGGLSIKAYRELRG